MADIKKSYGVIKICFTLLYGLTLLCSADKVCIQLGDIKRGEAGNIPITTYSKHPSELFWVTGLTGGRVVGFDLWQRSRGRRWPAMLNGLQPAAVQAALVIFYGTLQPDERTRRVCLPDWNCIKEKERRKENEPGCHWSENCSMAAWLEQMKGLISFDNTQQWVMTPKLPSPSEPSRCFTRDFLLEAWPYLLDSLCYTLPCLHPLYAQQPAACRLCAPR